MNPQTDPTYEELLARAARLQPDQQLLLLEGLATIVRRRIASDEKKKRSVLELQGLGKETWGGRRRPQTRRARAWFLEWLEGLSIIPLSPPIAEEAAKIRALHETTPR